MFRQTVKLFMFSFVFFSFSRCALIRDLNSSEEEVEKTRESIVKARRDELEGKYKPLVNKITKKEFIEMFGKDPNLCVHHVSGNEYCEFEIYHGSRWDKENRQKMVLDWVRTQFDENGTLVKLKQREIS